MKFFHFHNVVLLSAFVASQTSTTTYTFTTKITSTVTVDAPKVTTSALSICSEASPIISSLQNSLVVLRDALDLLLNQGDYALTNVSISQTFASKLGGFTSALEPLTARQNIVPSGSPQPPAFLPPKTTCSDNTSYICQVVGSFTQIVSTIGIPEGILLPQTLFSLSPTSQLEYSSSISDGNLLLTPTSSKVSRTSISETSFLENSAQNLTSAISTEYTLPTSATILSSASRCEASCLPATTDYMAITTIPSAQQPKSASQESFGVRRIATPLLLQILVSLVAAVYITSTAWGTTTLYAGTLTTRFQSVFRTCLNDSLLPCGGPNSPSSSTIPAISILDPSSVSRKQITSTREGLRIIPVINNVSTDSVASDAFPTEIQPPSTSTGRGPVTSIILSTTIQFLSQSSSSTEKPTITTTHQNQALRKLPNPIWLLLVCAYAAAMINVGIWKEGKSKTETEAAEISEQQNGACSGRERNEDEEDEDLWESDADIGDL